MKKNKQREIRENKINYFKSKVGQPNHLPFLINLYDSAFVFSLPFLFDEFE
jgi:hypothetical protein